MTNTVGVVGIDLERLTKQFGSSALQSSGNNFGNMLFTNAAYRQINNTKHIGFSWDPKEVNEKFSSIFIPAANWINKNQDWGHLAKLIEETDLPCVAVGMGSQIQSLDHIGQIPSGTLRLLKVISERSTAIGVRGQFTADVVKSCGIPNIETLGCPSIFMTGQQPVLRDIRTKEIQRIGIGPTRYVLNEINNSNRFDKQRQLYQFAIHEASSIYYQSEQYEIDVISRENKLTEQDNLAMSYYGIHSKKNLHGKLFEKGRYHTNLESWLSDVKRDDIYIGSRIHGAIAATLAGTPAILITHDKRTQELADVMCVPSISIDDFELAQLYDLHHLIKSMDFDKFIRRSMNNIKLLKEFYCKNKLDNNISL